MREVLENFVQLCFCDIVHCAGHDNARSDARAWPLVLVCLPEPSLNSATQPPLPVSPLIGQRVRGLLTSQHARAGAGWQGRLWADLGTGEK